MNILLYSEVGIGKYKADYFMQQIWECVFVHLLECTPDSIIFRSIV